MVMYGLKVIHECLTGDSYRILLFYVKSTELTNLLYWIFPDSMEITSSQELTLSCPEIKQSKRSLA